MPIQQIPIDDDPPQEIKDNFVAFLNELVSLCNKYRVWVILQASGYLRDEVMEGKLLDVAGFYYDEKVKNILPYYVDRMSMKDDTVSNE